MVPKNKIVSILKHTHSRLHSVEKLTVSMISKHYIIVCEENISTVPFSTTTLTHTPTQSGVRETAEIEPADWNKTRNLILTPLSAVRLIKRQLQNPLEPKWVRCTNHQSPYTTLLRCFIHLCYTVQPWFANSWVQRTEVTLDFSSVAKVLLVPGQHITIAMRRHKLESV